MTHHYVIHDTHSLHRLAPKVDIKAPTGTRSLTVQSSPTFPVTAERETSSRTRTVPYALLFRRGFVSVHLHHAPPRLRPQSPSPPSLSFRYLRHLRSSLASTYPNRYTSHIIPTPPTSIYPSIYPSSHPSTPSIHPTGKAFLRRSGEGGVPGFFVPGSACT